MFTNSLTCIIHMFHNIYNCNQNENNNQKLLKKSNEKSLFEVIKRNKRTINPSKLTKDSTIRIISLQKQISRKKIHVVQVLVH